MQINNFTGRPLTKAHAADCARGLYVALRSEGIWPEDIVDEFIKNSLELWADDDDRLGDAEVVRRVWVAIRDAAGGRF